MEPRDNGWLIAWLLFIKHDWTPPPTAPHPLKLAHSPADLHFRASGPWMDQVAQFTVAKTLRALFPPFFRLRTHFSRHIDLLCAKKLYESGQQTEWNPKQLCLCTSSAQKQSLAQHKHPKIHLFVVTQKYQFRSYLWFFLHRWPGMRFCPSHRAGEHRTCRTLTSWRGTRVLFFKRQRYNFGSRRLTSHCCPGHRKGQNVSKAGSCRNRRNTKS